MKFSYTRFLIPCSYSEENLWSNLNLNYSTKFKEISQENFFKLISLKKVEDWKLEGTYFSLIQKELVDRIKDLSKCWILKVFFHREFTIYFAFPPRTNLETITFDNIAMRVGNVVNLPYKKLHCYQIYTNSEKIKTTKKINAMKPLSNTLYIVDKDKSETTYDMFHMFGPFKESKMPWISITRYNQDWLVVNQFLDCNEENFDRVLFAWNWINKNENKHISISKKIIVRRNDRPKYIENILKTLFENEIIN